MEHDEHMGISVPVRREDITLRIKLFVRITALLMTKWHKKPKFHMERVTMNFMVICTCDILCTCGHMVLKKLTTKQEGKSVIAGDLIDTRDADPDILKRSISKDEYLC